MPSSSEEFVYIGDIIPGSYITQNGSFSDYSGWSRSDYIYIRGLSTLTIDMPRSGRTLGFYGSNYAVVSTVLNLPSGVSNITVPSGAYYFVISEDDTNILLIRYIPLGEGPVLVPIETIVSGEYVKPDGSFEAYAGWSRSDYVYIKGLSTLRIDMPRSGRTLGFYASNHSVTGTATNLPAGLSEITVPEGSYYFVISEDDTNILLIRYAPLRLGGGTINIPSVSGVIVITAIAIPSVKSTAFTTSLSGTVLTVNLNGNEMDAGTVTVDKIMTVSLEE